MNESKADEADQLQDPRDLIDEYDQYLKQKALQKMDLDDDEAPSETEEVKTSLKIAQDLEQFDYME